MVIFLHSGTEQSAVTSPETGKFKENLLELSKQLLEFAIKERFLLTIEETSLFNVQFRFDFFTGTKRNTLVKVITSELIASVKSVFWLSDEIKQEVMYSLGKKIKETLETEKVFYEVKDKLGEIIELS